MHPRDAGWPVLDDLPGVWKEATVALTEQGYAVLPEALPELAWRGLRTEAGDLFERHAFRAARVGRGDGVRTEGPTRGGSVCWLDGSMVAGEALMVWMDGLRIALNHELFLGLESFEAQYAKYPVGAAYEAHVDRHLGSTARVVSAVLYLNAEWPSDAGGELVIYDAKQVPCLTLSPCGGTLVLFMSAGTVHEAKRASRERWSIAGWFRAPGGGAPRSVR
jgi:SM-20-related protein